jgi:hypothetical protein
LLEFGWRNFNKASRQVSRAKFVGLSLKKGLAETRFIPQRDFGQHSDQILKGSQLL